ncbi:MAG: class I SAM-dependent methyltransferase [Clostridium butyricum]|uniref:class I SAM-dependent methyltransferase n=1 Tax=Clostridium butyricum TaxID=1492 RepID=UPI002900B42E|nr:class I SAM-dependent methyltransferase [Clostridium butyricum]
MKIAVTTTRQCDVSLMNKAQSVSEELDIPYIKRENIGINQILENRNIEYLLVVEKDKITLKGKDSVLFWHPNMSELKIKSINKGNKEALIESTQLKDGDSVLDCTLGLAGDSLVFSFVVGENGKVVGTEVNKFIAYLCKNGLSSYKNNKGETPQYMKNIKVINVSYEEYLTTQSNDSFDVVYFDPMFKKPNKKSSSINALRNFANHNSITKKTLLEALRVCKKRVVIKERQGENDFETLGIKTYYGSEKSGSIIYGVIEKRDMNQFENQVNAKG